MNNFEIFGVPTLKNGSGIHIKKENKGKFTDYCGGKVTDECIQQGKNSSNPITRKRATFAGNARKWKHQKGAKIQKYQSPSNPINTTESEPTFKQKMLNAGKAASGFLPIVGTYQEFKNFKENPSWSNAGWLALSAASDALTLTGIGAGAGAAIKAGKAARIANKTADVVSAARKTNAASNLAKTYNVANNLIDGTVKTRTGNNVIQQFS